MAVNALRRAARPDPKTTHGNVERARCLRTPHPRFAQYFQLAPGMYSVHVVECLSLPERDQLIVFSLSPDITSDALEGKRTGQRAPFLATGRAPFETRDDKAVLRHPTRRPDQEPLVDRARHGPWPACERAPVIGPASAPPSTVCPLAGQHRRGSSESGPEDYARCPVGRNYSRVPQLPSAACHGVEFAPSPVPSTALVRAGSAWLRTRPLHRIQTPQGVLRLLRRRESSAVADP